jgi:hypothetical protein
MKIAAISGDLAIKLALGVAVLGVAAYAAYKVKNIASDATAWASDHLDPTSPNNVAYSTVNTWGGAVVTDPNGPGKNADGSWSLGGWAFDILNPGTADAVRNITH